jgi:sulfite reductase (NADPH) flavoprotein alpha-component
MINLFAYASNMSGTSLNGKGVKTVNIEPAVLADWRMVFDIPDPFPIQGSLANIIPSTGHKTHGALLQCEDEYVEALDRMEAVGIVYERRSFNVETYLGERRTASAYVAIPKRTATEDRPSLRYRNLIVAGGREVGLNATYLEWLSNLPIHPHPTYAAFDPRTNSPPTISNEELKMRPNHTALYGHVFDMSDARPDHDFLRPFFVGTDATMYLLKRMDGTDGAQSVEALELGQLSENQKKYLNDYLHEFSQQYRYVGILNNE